MLRRQLSAAIPLAPFLESLFAHPPLRVPGTAVFLTATPDATPHALMHNLNHNKVLHERVIFLTVEIHDVPWVPFEDRVEMRRLGHGCFALTVRYGFMNRPDVPNALQIAEAQGLDIEMMETSFFLSREIVVPVAANGEGMALWRERLFATMARNASNAADYFNIPANRVIELGTRVEI
jgi:KUP system potassium uptake protein